MVTRLTSAEHEIVVLAMHGFSNRQIALRRCVSESTVVNQLSAAYRKLGVRSRRELCALDLTSGSRVASPQREKPDASLSPREHIALDRAKAGQSNKLIADSLGVAISTVSTMLTRARRKLRLASETQRAQAAHSDEELSTVSEASVFRQLHNE